MGEIPVRRWQQIEAILDRALDLEAEERRAYVEEACAGDETLLAEVEALLRADESSHPMLDSSPGKLAASWLERLVEEPSRSPTVELVPGTCLGKYEIRKLIGAGGMGEVYWATDRDLGRTVAIKVLPEALVDDPERLARFRREARILASLNHPNIGGIYGLERERQQPFLVLELVPGQGLDELLSSGPLPLDGALTAGVQIARALEAAHERGVVHRDLKPSNIRLTPQGVVKVLDFGIAKAGDGPGETDLTRTGVILGTASYMSPEQARGQAADKRADIWSFGVVFWEMLTGRRLFDGETTSDILAAVLRAEIPKQDLPADLPGSVALMLDRCLTRDSNERLQDMADARAELERVLVSRPDRGQPLWPRIAAFGSVAALAVAGVLYLDRGRDETTPPPDVEASEILTVEDAPVAFSGPSVAVIPFRNASGDPAQDYYVLGLVDDLIFGLMQQKSFPVIAREAMWGYRDNDAPASEVARELGAEYLVQGSVRRVGDRLRVLADITNAEGEQVWARRFEEEADQVVAMSDQLIASVAGALLGSEIERVERSVPVDAWELYVKALGVMLDYEPDRFDEARRYAKEATELAPDMAEAWWARGELQVWQTMFHAATRDEYIEGLQTSIEYLRRAHELSPFHSGTCGCLGVLLTALGDEDGAAVIFDEAVKANPYSSPLRVDYSAQLASVGAYDRAREQADIALDLDPVSQERAVAWTSRAVASLNQGDEHDARKSIERSLLIDRYNWTASAGVGVLYLLGEKDEAKKLLDDLLEMFPNLSPDNPLIALVLRGPEDALVQGRSEGRTDLPADMIGVFTELGWKSGVEQ